MSFSKKKKQKLNKLCALHIKKTNVIFLSVIGTKLCNANVERERERERERDVQCELWTKGNKRLDCAISFAIVMGSSMSLPYVQHNNKNDLEASGSHSNVDSNIDENESSSNSNAKIENVPILDTVRLLLYFSIYLYFLLLVPNLNQYSIFFFKKKILSILIFKTFLPSTMQKWNKN